MEAGVCGPPGGSAAGPVEVESPPPSDTATAPGTAYNDPHCGKTKNIAVIAISDRNSKQANQRLDCKVFETTKKLKFEVMG